MAEHNLLGEWGEQKAAEYLVSKGYYIRDRDYKFGKRDLDIIAISPDQTTLVFVEVKTRSDENFAPATFAVDKKKIRNLAITANYYIKENALDYDARFDIITVVGTSDADARIDHVVDAFNPLLSY